MVKHFSPQTYYGTSSVLDNSMAPAPSTTTTTIRFSFMFSRRAFINFKLTWKSCNIFRTFSLVRSIWHNIRFIRIEGTFSILRNKIKLWKFIVNRSSPISKWNHSKTASSFHATVNTTHWNSLLLLFIH